jgi:hypothetical protein
MTTFRTHFAFRVDTWTPDGESIVEHVAGVEDYQVALATYRAPSPCGRARELSRTAGACARLGLTRGGRAGFRRLALTTWPLTGTNYQMANFAPDVRTTASLPDCPCSRPARPAKLRGSVAVAVAVAAPIETVVDPHLHHLDVAVPLDERVSGKESEPNRSNKCPVV